MTLVLSLSAFVVALLGPAQTLAQTRKTACPTSATHGKKKHAARCTQASHKGKSQTRRARHHAKLAPAKKTSQTSTPAAASVEPARCEGGQTPVRAADGTFSCSDGSEPECEDGATPTPSHKGKSLVCPVSSEAESSSTAVECEEEELACSTAAGEQPCETSGSDGSSFSCEADSED